ncbi:hypothetical protein [uncultured Parabacteroides sp.]|uniref:hypothetical protein n=1 Tax=uncultured Parabacteroides sp. TaxID=512312 RepID=UPI0026066EDA|nr:hypothetical protein [uncultured Parabacteroides sp.]
MRRYLFILATLFVCGTSVFSQETNSLKSVFQNALRGYLDNIPQRMEIRLYENESAPLEQTEFITNVLYKLVVEPLSSHTDSNFYLYWKLKASNGEVIASQNLCCGFHLGIFGIRLEHEGTYAVEVTVETYDKSDSVTLTTPIVVKENIYSYNVH